MRVEVERVLPSGSTEVEPARAFLQDRLSLWAFWVFVLAFGFYVINLATWPFVRRASETFADAVFHTGNLDHLAASLLFAGVWLLTRQRSFSMPALRRLEVATALAGGLLFALMGAYMARQQLFANLDSSIGLYAGLLACANTVMARAIIVPSTLRRTLFISIGAMAPLLPLTLWASGGSAAVTLNVATWCAVSIAIAAVGSHVIFGLRHEAARVRRLGQYTLDQKIGAGGMGVVYRASHAMLRRPTAIKLLPPDRAGSGSLARFEREVQLTAQLSHPNTVAIYDYGRTPDGVFYYAMEFLDGINLEDLVRRYGAQPPGRVVRLITQVCGALIEAHGRGLVHRDIKPANIILTERGGEYDVAKVVDFGLVRTLGDGAQGATVTGTNVLAGTPLYMSPESMTMPEAPDARSDLYALGAVAYFLLCGRPVFEGASVAEVIGHHLHTVPVPLAERAAQAIPPEIDRLVLRCLAKQPDQRPQSARELRDALRALRPSPAWTENEAERWWQAFREGHGHTVGDPVPAPGEVAEEAAHLTVTVDLNER